MKDGTMAADLGLLARHDIGFGELRVGAAIQTLGPRFRQHAVVGELPTMLRTGVCYVVTVPQLLTSEGEQWMHQHFRFGRDALGEYMLNHWRLVVCCDMNMVLTRYVETEYDDTWPLKPQLSLGAEVRPLPFFAFRLGYYDDMRLDPWSYPSLRGWTMGMGLDLKYLRIDIADDHSFYRDNLTTSPFRLRLSVSSTL